MASPMTPTSACDQAKRALHDSAIFVLKELNVSQDGSNLILSGKVQSFYHKQLAQEVVRSVVRDLTLVNRVDVG